MKNVVVIMFGVIALAAVLSAQNAAPADATTAALVNELRALRADINRIAGASIRSQLLSGRLQLQEQRILTLTRQIADVQKEISGVAQARVPMEAHIKRMEENTLTGQEREEAAEVAQQFRFQLGEHQKREQELRQQENQLSALLADEQARWTDFNSRLDELERTLTVPRNRD